MVRPRRLRCAFCGKPEEKVARLLAGARGHICDACVGVCNAILAATPEAPAGWAAMTDAELLDALKPSAAAVDGARAVLQSVVDTLRARRVSWEAIGGALGVSRQAAWERFS